MGKGSGVGGAVRRGEEPLRRAVDLGARDAQTLLALATAEWENGEPDRAAETFGAVLVATGRSPAVLHALGRLLVWSGRYEEALAPLEEARRSAPNDGLLLVDLARALDGAGRTAEAIAVYRQALELVPEYWEARYRLGLLLSRTGEDAAAEEELRLFRRQQRQQQAEERRAGLERARLGEARRLLESGDLAAAAEALEGLAEDPDVLLVRALVRRAAGDPEGAVTILRRAVALAPEREDLRSALTAARLAMGGR
ncbi:MAG: tetratricopeptide repeat protein [Thermoanaerobaculia bacterium]